MKFEPTLVNRLRNAKHVVVFTGAGVSQESGIPTFRDVMTGLWSTFSPEDLATPAAFREQPGRVWGWYEWRRRAVMAAQPNPAHLAIAAMASHVPQLTVITQNVDDLHERAGSRGVIHLHGSLHHPRCSVCGRAHVLPADASGTANDGTYAIPPNCVDCGGRVRPGVVWFGEPLNSDTLRQATQAAHACDLLLSIGTSSVVYPAAALPFEAIERGACVVQVNSMHTELDPFASYNVRGKAGEVMAALFATTWGRQVP